MCSCFSAYARGLSSPPLVNTLGDHLIFGPHENLFIRLCIRGLVCHHVKTVTHFLVSQQPLSPAQNLSRIAFAELYFHRDFFLDIPLRQKHQGVFMR